MQILKWVYEKLGVPIIITYIILFSKPLGDRIVIWGWCTANSPNCQNLYSLILFSVGITIIGLLAEIIKRRFWGSNILKVTTIDFSDLNEIRDIQRVEDQSMSGVILYAGLNIENKTDQEISKCYGTLEYIEQIVGGDKERILEDGFQLWASDHYPKRILSWKTDGSDKQDYKISIAPKSKTILRVGQIFLGMNKKTGLSADFDFCNFSPVDGLHSFGLYKIRIRIDGKKKNGMEDIKPVFFTGWLFSELRTEANGAGPNAKLESYYHLSISKGNPLKRNRLSIFFAYLAFAYQATKKVSAYNKIVLKNEKSGNHKNSEKQP